MNTPFQDGEKRILVVDENHDLVHSLARILRLNGYVVDEASSLAEAVPLSMAHCPNLIILDLPEPGLSDLESCRQIQEVCPKAAFVILVSTEHELQEVRATGTPALRKPFEITGLLNSLMTLGSPRDTPHLCS